MSLIPYDVEAQKRAAAQLVERFSVSTLLLAAQSLEVTDEESYTQMVVLRTRFTEAEKKITDFWRPLVEAGNSLHKMLTGARAETLKLYVEGKDITTRKAEAYLLRQRQLKREAEEALARAAEQSRRELEMEAKRLALRGEMKQAENLKMQATMSMAPTLPDLTPKVAGAKTAVVWKWNVTDIVAVAAAIARGDVALMHQVKPGDTRPLIVVDPVVMNAIVARLGDGIQIPGIAIEEGVKLSSTGR